VRSALWKPGTTASEQLQGHVNFEGCRLGDVATRRVRQPGNVTRQPDLCKGDEERPKLAARPVSPPFKPHDLE